jgi:hypothetical protein
MRQPKTEPVAPGHEANVKVVDTGDMTARCNGRQIAEAEEAPIHMSRKLHLDPALREPWVAKFRQNVDGDCPNRQIAWWTRCQDVQLQTVGQGVVSRDEAVEC